MYLGKFKVIYGARQFRMDGQIWKYNWKRWTALRMTCVARPWLMCRPFVSDSSKTDRLANHQCVVTGVIPGLFISSCILTHEGQNRQSSSAIQRLYTVAVESTKPYYSKQNIKTYQSVFSKTITTQSGSADTVGYGSL